MTEKELKFYQEVFEDTLNSQEGTRIVKELGKAILNLREIVEKYGKEFVMTQFMRKMSEMEKNDDLG